MRERWVPPYTQVQNSEGVRDNTRTYAPVWYVQRVVKVAREKKRKEKEAERDAERSLRESTTAFLFPGNFTSAVGKDAEIILIGGIIHH